MKLTKLTTSTRQLATMLPNARKAGGDMVCVSLGYGSEAKSRTRYQRICLLYTSPSPRDS